MSSIVPPSYQQPVPDGDWNAALYKQNSSAQQDWAEQFMSKVAEIVSKKFGKTTIDVLDVGCGDAKVTAKIVRTKLAGSSIQGIDFSPKMVAYAKENFPDIKFQEMDAQKLTFRDEFDLIVSFTALHRVMDHTAFIQGANKSLRTNGILAITLPMNTPKMLDQAAIEVRSQDKWKKYFEGHADEEYLSAPFNYGDKEKFSTLLEANGFTSMEVNGILQTQAFPNAKACEDFLLPWYPYLMPLPENLRRSFLEELVARFRALEAPVANDEVHFKFNRLEVIAMKTNAIAQTAI